MSHLEACWDLQLELPLGDACCDLVIAQGTEAGGHTGTVATMPLVPQVVDAVGEHVPVVAAGGIDYDGGLPPVDDQPVPCGEEGVVPEGEVQCVAFTPDGNILAAGYDGVPGKIGGAGVVMWDMTRRKRLSENSQELPGNGVSSMDFSHDGKMLCAHGDHGVFFSL